MKTRILSVVIVVTGLIILLAVAVTAQAAQGDIPFASVDKISPPLPQGPSTLAASGPLWRLGGSAESVAIQGNYAYLVQGMRLLVIDLTTKEVVGELHLPYPARDVAVSGDYAYLVTSTYGDLHIVNIQDPANPYISGDTLSISWSGGEGVAVRWPYAYVICEFPADGLAVFNVTNPTDPSLETQTTGVSGRWARLGADHLYVLAWNELYIFDIVTDPANPEEKGRLGRGGENLAVAEPYVYVTGTVDFWPGVHVVDVGDPTDPEVVEDWAMGWTGSTLGVAQRGNYLYVGYNPNFWGSPYPSIRILDITNPLAVIQADYHVRFSGLYSFIISDTTLYVAGGGDGDLIGLALTSPTSPSEDIFLSQPGYTEKVRVVGDRAYVVVRSDHDSVRRGLWVFDLSAPLSPVELDKEDWLGHIYNLEIAEPYVYIAGGSGLCLQIRHMDDVWTPVGSSSHEYTCYDVAVKSPAAYVVVPNKGLDVLDVSTPGSPTVVGTVPIADLPPQVWSYVAVDGNRAYVWRPGKFFVLDISTPLNPTLAATHELAGLTTLYPKGDYMYVGTGMPNGLTVLDVEDLENIQTLGTYPTLNAVTGVDVMDYVAYISGEGFVHALNVADPENLTPMYSYQYSGRVRGADIQGMGPLALVADEDLGLTLHAIADGLVSPAGGDPGAVLPWEALVVTFAQPMNTGLVTYVCSPDPGGWQETWGASGSASTQDAGNGVLTLTHNPFPAGQDYTFTVTGGQTTEGEDITPFSLTFSAVEGHRIFLPLTMRNF